jgi:predicted MFS family arabinose efflux permease
MMTELVPSARATLLASNLAASALGRGLGAFIGPYLFDIGLNANTGFAAIIAVVALIVLNLGVKEHE